MPHSRKDLLGRSHDSGRCANVVQSGPFAAVAVLFPGCARTTLFYRRLSRSTSGTRTKIWALVGSRGEGFRFMHWVFCRGDRIGTQKSFSFFTWSRGYGHAEHVQAAPGCFETSSKSVFFSTKSGNITPSLRSKSSGVDFTTCRRYESLLIDPNHSNFLLGIRPHARRDKDWHRGDKNAWVDSAKCVPSIPSTRLRGAEIVGDLTGTRGIELRIQMGRTMLLPPQPPARKANPTPSLKNTTRAASSLPSCPPDVANGSRQFSICSSW